jgi:hypothetical protein
MIVVECDRCFARHRYDETRFEGRPSRKLRCVKCHEIFEVYNTHAFETLPRLLDGALPGVASEAEPGSSELAEKAERRPAGRGAFELRLPEEGKLSLAVISGPCAGKVFPIDKPRVVIGGSGADVDLDDPEISREHAVIEVAGDRVTIVDLESSTGTFVRDRRVHDATIHNHGEFTVGGSTLMLIVTQTPSP